MESFLVLRLESSGASVIRVVDRRELADIIDEDDTPRFLQYSIAGDWYEYGGNTIVVRLGRRFSPEDHG